MAVILRREGVADVPGAWVDSGDLWVPLGDLERASGWEHQPEGFCKDEMCVPVPPARESLFIHEGMFNMSAWWRHLGQALARDDRGETWFFGEEAFQRHTALGPVEAPDFRLPDVHGKEHALSDLRGRKIFVTVWASW
ncbi:MAG: hypothetical protein IIC82_07300 [Chloroflexi bacterium]|nr:hypothetical protein [Chloroflexota bacterium]